MDTFFAFVDRERRFEYVNTGFKTSITCGSRWLAHKMAAMRSYLKKVFVSSTLKIFQLINFVGQNFQVI